MTMSFAFDPVEISRDRLFFDCYQYGMCFRFYHSGRMRSLDHAAIKKSVAWARNSALLTQRDIITDHYLQHMLDLSDAITAITQPFKRVVYSDWQYFYTNCPEIFAGLAAMPGVKYTTYTKAVIDRPRDTVILQHSDYAWRSYFQERMYPQEQIALLSNFILSRDQQFKITNTWRERLPQKWCYINRSFFVDHHDQRDALLLNMVIPGCVRKTLPIVSRQ